MVVVVVVVDDDAAVCCTSQGLFSVTELLSTFLVLPLCDVTVSPTARRCLAILTIAMFHIITACYDQFTANVVLGEGAWHQWSRDVGFMLVDVLYVVIATCWWFQLLNQSSHRALVSRDELLLALISVILLFILALAT